jgi:RimJ/RimL family protein N-acetyltransferase
MKLIVAKSSDYELIIAWRSDPEIYQGFYSQERSLTWDEHLQWLLSRNHDWREFLIWYEGRRIGVVTIGQLDHWNPEIGYLIGEKSLWGQGLGTKAVHLALDYLRAHNKEFCHTTVLNGNKRSIGLLKSLGFEYKMDARDDEIWMEKRL